MIFSGDALIAGSLNHLKSSKKLFDAKNLASFLDRMQDCW